MTWKRYWFNKKRRLHKTFGYIVGCAPLPRCVSQFHDLDFLTAPTDPYVLCLHYLGKLYSSHSNPCTYLFMYITQGVLIQGAYNFFNFKTIHFIFSSGNGILLPKLFWPTVRKNCFSDWEKLWILRLKAEYFQKFWDH